MDEKHPIHILLVEDNLDHAALVIRNLERFNVMYVVDHLEDGEMAINYLKKIKDEKIHPNIILLDLRLPKIDGMEVLKFARENEYLHNIPIVILTTSEAERDIVHANGLFTNGYLVKPIDFVKFSELMNKLGLLRFNNITDNK